MDDIVRTLSIAELLITILGSDSRSLPLRWFHIKVPDRSLEQLRLTSDPITEVKDGVSVTLGAGAEVIKYGGLVVSDVEGGCVVAGNVLYSCVVAGNVLYCCVVAGNVLYGCVEAGNVLYGCVEAVRYKVTLLKNARHIEF